MNHGPLKLERSDGTSMRPAHRWKAEPGAGWEGGEGGEARRVDPAGAAPVAPADAGAAAAERGRDAALEVRLPGEHRRDVAREARLDVDLVEAGVAEAARIGGALED